MKTTITEEIQIRRNKHNIDIIEAIISFCEEYNIPIEEIVDEIKDELKGDIEQEFIKRGTIKDNTLARLF